MQEELEKARSRITSFEDDKTQSKKAFDQLRQDYDLLKEYSETKVSLESSFFTILRGPSAYRKLSLAFKVALICCPGLSEQPLKVWNI